MVELLGGGRAELEELRPLVCDSEVCVGITASFLLFLLLRGHEMSGSCFCVPCCDILHCHRPESNVIKLTVD